MLFGRKIFMTKIQRLKKKLYNNWLEGQYEELFDILEDLWLNESVKTNIKYPQAPFCVENDIITEITKKNIYCSKLKAITINYIDKNLELVTITKKLAQEIYNKVKK
jgi:hypothetical protein